MSTRTRASAAGPRVTLTSGISRRNCWTSPRPRSSMPTASFTGASAGTSSMNLRTASSIRALASSATPHHLLRRLSDLVTLQQLAADHHALDLGRPLADQQQRRVAIDALDLVLLGVAVATVDAQALLGAEAARLRGEQLRHAGLHVRALAGVLHRCGTAHEQPRGVDLGGHVGELELDRLVLGDRLAERLALLGVFHGQLERALGEPHAARRDVDPAEVERVHHLHEALVQALLFPTQD